MQTKSLFQTCVIFLQDHEFIPTRSKTITASRPAANPNQFTKIPSNPLLISAQKQIMQAEEIRKRKESEKMVRKGDDEPDWQNVSLKRFYRAGKFANIIICQPTNFSF